MKPSQGQEPDASSPNGDDAHTVAQRPTEIGRGAPRTAPAENAHHHHEEPYPGAQPPEEAVAPEQAKASSVAAGVQGVYQTLRFAWKEMGVTRGLKTLLNLNQKKGFDCQSCAWPSPDDHRKVAEFCENGAKAVADEGTTKRVTRDFFRSHSISELREQSDYWLGQQGRLTEPMIKREGSDHYEPISWPAAFALLAHELNALPSPDAAAFYTSGRTSNEAAFLYQLFARQFGTNNLPDCSNMCHESSGSALSEAIGVGKGCVKLEDFDHADAIFIIGQNPGTNHPRMLSSLESAKQKRDGHHGAKIVSINPLPEVGNFRF
ncbi:MAG TPA: molybdopterin-dependent oxidoreductase, partial [Chthoniobacteraceae bacterium]